MQDLNSRGNGVERITSNHGSHVVLWQDYRAFQPVIIYANYDGLKRWL